MQFPGPSLKAAMEIQFKLIYMVLHGVASVRETQGVLNQHVFDNFRAKQEQQRNTTLENTDHWYPAKLVTTSQA